MPRPYSFGYQAKGMRSNQFRDEIGDGKGMVSGSYGYQDAQGLYRQVDYVAGPGMGFQAKVRTNEPGTKGHQHEHPAHVMLQAQQPPPGVQTHFGGMKQMNMMSGGMGMMKSYFK